jgi:short-subunit dehydrogenase
MARKLSESVVVITGASSGIGRAAAVKFAKAGSSVVLAARRANLLEDVALECRDQGVQALAVPLDVTDYDGVQGLARRTAESFGRVDVWVNNAGVSLFGRFEETPWDSYRQVIETNLFGYLHGARAAIPYFREQGRGVLINNASMAANVGQPYTSAYVASKHAIKGVGMSLRQELRDAPGIHVCTVLPAVIDTPLFEHAGNYTGREVRAMPPVYRADKVANTIVALAAAPRRHAYVGNSGRMMSLQQVLLPALTERLIAEMVERLHLYQDRRADPTDGNLFGPVEHGPGVSGGWDAAGNPTDAVTAVLGAAATPLVAASAAIRRVLSP